MQAMDRDATAVDAGKEPVARLENVSKIYYKGTQEINALKDVTFQVNEGDFITIQGPSGSGKTTLLNLIALMDTPTSGTVYIKGKLASDLSDDEQSEFRGKNIGFVFQYYNLIEHLTALDNVAIALGAGGMKDSKKRKEKAKEILEKLGLGDRLYNMPGEMSGGEQQRVTIARSIVNDPAFIIADEPTGDLDSENGEKVIALFKELNDNGRTIIIITHNPEIGAMGKRQVMMRDGKIVSDA